MSDNPRSERVTTDMGRATKVFGLTHVADLPYIEQEFADARAKERASFADDLLLASVMRKLLLTPGPMGYASIDNMDGTFDIDTSGVPLTIEEQKAIDRVWDS